MADKFKKIDKTFTLSDSSVNVYGYRLLTSGYLADKFQRNPIGYYMHKREDGVLLKWENLRTEGDRILAEPVVNLSHPRGEQTVNEIESGFLNAASMGRIIPLELSDDPSMQLEGQVLPTVTKWYNKECSLVDIPGNDSALACLYDEQGEELHLTDLSDNKLLIKQANKHMLELKLQVTADLIKKLNLTDTADAAAVLKGIHDLADKAAKYDTGLADKAKLEADLETMRQASVAKEVKDLLDAGLKAGKLTNELVTELAESHKENPTGLKSLIDKLPHYKSVTEQLSTSGATNKEGKALADLSWEELDKGGYLPALKSQHPEVYIQKFEGRYGRKPNN